jgi:hypothetical protein
VTWCVTPIGTCLPVERNGEGERPTSDQIVKAGSEEAANIFKNNMALMAALASRYEALTLVCFGRRIRVEGLPSSIALAIFSSSDEAFQIPER